MNRRPAPVSKWLVFLALAVAPACAVTQTQRGPALSNKASWVVLPFTNLAETTRAGDRVASLASTLLRVRGVKDLNEYATPHDALPQVEDGPRLTDAIAWARARGYVYGVTGRVQEWRYRTGTDGEPAVGLSLAIIDIASGRTVWAGAGSRSGWRQDTVSGTAQRLLADLLDQVDLR